MITSGAGDPDFIREISHSRNTQYAVSKAALNMVITQFALALSTEPQVEGEKGFTVLGLSPGVVSSWSALPSTYCRTARPGLCEPYLHCALITRRPTCRGGRADAGENEDAVRWNEAVRAALGRGAAHTGAICEHDDGRHPAHWIRRQWGYPVSSRNAAVAIAELLELDVTAS